MIANVNAWPTRTIDVSELTVLCVSYASVESSFVPVSDIA